MTNSYNSSSSMSSRSRANGASANTISVNGAQPARDSMGRFCRRDETPRRAVEIHGHMSFGKPYMTFNAEEREAWKAERDARRSLKRDASAMRRKVEKEAGVALPETLYRAGLLERDRLVVIYISREHSWNEARGCRDNWPKLKIVSKPRDVSGLADPKSDDRYATYPISAGSDLFVMSADVQDGTKKVLFSDITGRKLIDARKIVLRNSSRYEESVDPDTGEIVPSVTVKKSYAALAGERRISADDFLARIEGLVTDYPMSGAEGLRL